MINRMVLQGRLTHTPELKQTQSGISVCSFRVAWSEKYNETETKLFLSCTAWRGIAEFVTKYFSKGQEIAVEGRLSTRDWQDKDGNNRSTIELTVDKAHFCGPKQSGTGGAYGSGGTEQKPEDLFGDELSKMEPIEEGELPF